MGEEIRISWEEFYRGVSEIKSKVIRDVYKGEFRRYKKVIAVAEGGKGLGYIIGEFLKIPVEVVRIKNYDKREKVGNKSLRCRDKKVLVVDDICDTGTTLREVESDIVVWAIKGEKKNKNIKYYYKKFKEDEWVIFPWEKE